MASSGTTKPSFERSLKRLTFAVGLPGTLVALGLLWFGDHDPKLRWTLTWMVLLAWLAIGASLVNRVRLPLQTLANILGGLREGDFSTRARGARRDDALGEVFIEVNALGETLKEQRLGALEATALLRTVMEELDVAVFAFDGVQRLRLVNRAGENLLQRRGEQLLGRTAHEIGLAGCLEGEPAQTMTMSLPGGVGRWGMRRSTFRQGGHPHQLLVLTDLSRALREEERQAWQRLVRVIGHELNNSLAPIKSIAASLDQILGQQPPAQDWREDMQRGLAVISSRAEALSRFMDAYSRLARLPSPRRQPVALAELVQRVAVLETRRPVEVRAGPALTIPADPDQLEQLLINLLRNAADAMLEATEPAGATGGITITWRRRVAVVELDVVDAGPGLANPGNIFVPFFTTKPNGSGIGLTLCRQIAEAHGGTLVLENRTDARGCIARVRLPVS